MKIGAHIIAMFILCAVKSVVKHVKSEVVALSKYIDSEVAYELARTSEYYSDFRRSTADLTSLKELLDDTPAVDAVKVVRCKDCEYGRSIDITKSPEKYFKNDCVVCECEDVVGDEPMIYRPDHFCSYGERRTEE